jgi:hypothetical protein
MCVFMCKRVQCAYACASTCVFMCMRVQCAYACASVCSVHLHVQVRVSSCACVCSVHELYLLPAQRRELCKGYISPSFDESCLTRRASTSQVEQLYLLYKGLCSIHQPEVEEDLGAKPSAKAVRERDTHTHTHARTHTHMHAHTHMRACTTR